MERVITLIEKLIFDEVLDNTFGVMRSLVAELAKIKVTELTIAQKERLKSKLLLLCSESIREALHKHELGITNSVIRVKNKLLTDLGIKIEDGHKEIDPTKYPHSW